MLHARRDLLRFGLAGASAAASGLAPKAALASNSGSDPFSVLQPRRVALHNLHTDERLDIVYAEWGRYVPDALSLVNRVLRDYRTGDEHPMNPELLDLLASLAQATGSKQPFQVISGYRSPRTNAMLHEHTSGVANNSFHMKGMAIDIRLPDVRLDHLHRAALSLRRGGVGYYPASDFVHVDVGPVRQWGADVHHD